MNFQRYLQLSFFLIWINIITINARTLPDIILKGELGSRVDKSEWSSKSLSGKINLVIYTTPNKEKSVRPLINKIKEKKFSSEKFGTTLIANLKVIAPIEHMVRKKLTKKALENKNVTYVIDRRKVLVNKWELKDGKAHILLFDASSNLISHYEKEVTSEYIDTLVKQIVKLITQ